LSGTPRARRGVLTAVESVMTLDAGFWAQFSRPDTAPRLKSGELRPDWRHRGFLRGYTDGRYSFGRYFSPLSPNRPRTVDDLYSNNDVVLYDRNTAPHETTNLAHDPAHRDLVGQLSQNLEALIDDELGADTHAWVPDRPMLLGIPAWRGDAA